jgi:hypothetical protein
VFVKEVQRAVLDGRADLAAHSAKDLPSTPHPGLVIGAFCARRSPADALVGMSLDQLAPGATVASGSVRRRAQLARVRPDLRFVELRGNIPTRLTKVPDDGALVMAVAAMEILGLTDRIAQVLDTAQFVPQVGQGCVAVECRDDDPRRSSCWQPSTTRPPGAPSRSSEPSSPSWGRGARCPWVPTWPAGCSTVSWPTPVTSSTVAGRAASSWQPNHSPVTTTRLTSTWHAPQRGAPMPP